MGGWFIEMFRLAIVGTGGNFGRRKVGRAVPGQEWLSSQLVATPYP